MTVGSNGAWGATVWSSSVNTDPYCGLKTTIKSGEHGSQRTANDALMGVYVSSRNTGTFNTAASMKVEGGWIYNLNGGPGPNAARAGRNSIFIYITGGNIDTVVGGAGQVLTYGNRIVSVTDGIVNYNVFGGSNGATSSGATDGQLNGSSVVYVGGNAQVGDSTYVSTTGNWDAGTGNVFGNGNGRQNQINSCGSNESAIVIIDGNANILSNVYGGGNYGAVGFVSTQATAKTDIKILGGIIQEDVYGAGNRAGAGGGTTTTIATINITMTGGQVLGNIYGGSNIAGIVTGSTNLNILEGIIETNIYGGGKGGPSGGAPGTITGGTFVSQDSNVTIGSNELSPSIGGSVYGGSAFGSVNGASNVGTVSIYNTTVIVNNGNITGSVFGGGQGDNTFTPWVMGNITVTINDGNIGCVYGGNDQAGTPNGSIIVYLNGGTIGQSYGGGNNSTVSNTKIYLQGATVDSLYGGSNISGATITSQVIVTSGTALNIFGGNNLGGSTYTSTIDINGGSIRKCIWRRKSSLYNGYQYINKWRDHRQCLWRAAI